MWKCRGCDFKTDRTLSARIHAKETNHELVFVEYLAICNRCGRVSVGDTPQKTVENFQKLHPEHSLKELVQAVKYGVDGRLEYYHRGDTWEDVS